MIICNSTSCCLLLLFLCLCTKYSVLCFYWWHACYSLLHFLSFTPFRLCFPFRRVTRLIHIRLKSHWLRSQVLDVMLACLITSMLDLDCMSGWCCWSVGRLVDLDKSTFLSAICGIRNRSPIQTVVKTHSKHIVSVVFPSTVRRLPCLFVLLSPCSFLCFVQLFCIFACRGRKRLIEFKKKGRLSLNHRFPSLTNH